MNFQNFLFGTKISSEIENFLTDYLAICNISNVGQYDIFQPINLYSAHPTPPQYRAAFPHMFPHML